VHVAAIANMKISLLAAELIAFICVISFDKRRHSYIAEGVTFGESF
jgi:hypothetical protein